MEINSRNAESGKRARYSTLIIVPSKEKGGAIVHRNELDFVTMTASPFLDLFLESAS